MSYSIATLLIRNLRDVFGENDPTRRRAAIDEIYTEDCVFYDPSKGVYRGRDEIDRIAGAIKATHPEFRYQPTTEPAESGNGGLVRWVSGRPGEAPAYAGTDFIVVRGVASRQSPSFLTSYPKCGPYKKTVPYPNRGRGFIPDDSVLPACSAEICGGFRHINSPDSPSTHSVCDCVLLA